MNRLVLTEGAVAVIGGEFSSTAITVVTKVSTPLGMPLLSPGAWTNTLTDTPTNPFFLRVGPSNRDVARAATVIMMHYKWNTIAVLASTSPYATDFASGVEAIHVSGEKAGATGATGATGAAGGAGVGGATATTTAAASATATASTRADRQAVRRVAYR